MRASLPALPSRGGSSGNPAAGIATDGSNSTNASTSYAAIPLSSLLAGDRFTLSGNTLTCLEGGVYQLNLLLTAFLSVGSHDFFISYRVNGNTDVPIQYGTNTVAQTFNLTTYLKLAAGDQVQIRAKCGTAAETVAVRGGTGATVLSLVQVSTFQ